MAKISKNGGATINVVDSGFVDDTERIRTEAAARTADEPQTEQPPVERPVLRSLPFDPSDYTVGDVQDLLRDMDQADAELVLEAERSGLKRKGLIG